MTDDKVNKIRTDLRKTTLPKLGGTLTDAQRAEVEIWTHVPPFDGCTFQLENTDGVIGGMHQQMLSGFQGGILSELISIEYLLAAVPLTARLASFLKSPAREFENAPHQRSKPPVREVSRRM